MYTLCFSNVMVETFFSPGSRRLLPHLLALFKLSPDASGIQILPHEVYLSFRIDMIHETLSNSVCLPQEALRVFRPRPLLFVAECDHLLAHGPDIPVFKDTPVL